MKLGATVVALLLLVGAIVWASFDESVTTGIAKLAALPWGLVTLLDLGIGLIFAGAWIAAIVGLPRALPWWIALLGLGNVSLLVFLCLRARHAESFKDWILPRAPGSTH